MAFFRAGRGKGGAKGRLSRYVEIFRNKKGFPLLYKNISDTLGCSSCATFLFLLHFDVICDLLLNRRTATWNLFVEYIVALGDCLWVSPSVTIVSHVTYGAITMCLVELLNCISVVPD